MSYQEALNIAWSELSGLYNSGSLTVKLLSDTYNIDVADKSILSLSCNAPAKEQVSLILLHYMIKKAGSPVTVPETGEWIDFNQLEGGQGYYPAFKKRAIDRIIKKYGSRPDSMLLLCERFPCVATGGESVSVVIRAFADVPIRITVQRSDDEFGPDANILYDKNISSIFCTEDIVVLTEFVIHLL